MELVLDAQIIKGFFDEDVIGIAHSLTESPGLIIDRLGSSDRANLDDGGQIQEEWKRPVDSEWFDVWYARLLADDAAREISVGTNQQLRSQLRNLGFPVRGPAGRDLWYVRTANAVADELGSSAAGRNPLAMIVSEDLHFYSPAEKATARGDARTKILLSGAGPVARLLSRKYQIQVTCVHNYLNLP